MVSAARAAQHIDLAERRFREFVAAGVITKAERRGYDLDRVRVEYIRHLREVASGREPAGDLDPAQERARRDRAMAEKVEMENDITRGRVVLIEDVVGEVSREYTITRERMQAIPSRIGGKVPAPVRDAVCALVAEEIEAALTALSADDVEPALPADDGGRPRRAPGAKGRRKGRR